LEELFVIADNDLNSQIFSFRFNYSLIGSVNSGIDEEFISFALVQIVCHIKSLSASAGLIKKRGVTDV
jgi:hypothetical protein